MTDKRKRAAPTIDLTATEVPSASDENAPAPEQTAEDTTAKPEPKSEARPEPKPEPPRAQAQTDARPEPRRPGYGVAIAAGLAGAVVASAVLGAVWYFGLLPQRSVVQRDDAQLAALKKQIEELQNRPAPAVDDAALAPLRRRVAKIEHDIAQLPPGDKTVAERLASADNAMKSLGIALAALNRRADDIAAKTAQAQESAAAAQAAVKALSDSVQNAKQDASSAVDSDKLDAMGKRLAALEQTLATARTEIAKDIEKASDPAARLALAAAALRDAVLRGAPYAEALGQVKALGGDEKTLAPLEPFAASGVPSRAALARELGALIPKMMDAAGAEKPPSGFFERLQANAGKLVRVSPVNAPSGDKPAEVLARLEVEAANFEADNGEIDRALADLAKLPQAVRAPAKAFIEKANARAAALTAADTLAADTARALRPR